MDPAILGLLPVSASHSIPASWAEDPLTQGNEPSPLAIVSMLEKEPVILSDTHTPAPAPTGTRDKEGTRGDTVPFLDMFAGMIDPLFQMYPYETKRDIRQHLKTRLVDWVSQNARAFFGPSTSRSISACIRGHSITLADVERFGELVSFFMDAAVQVGTKIIVWHGYGSTGRKPACSLVMKQQGVFVSGYKKMTQ